MKVTVEFHTGVDDPVQFACRLLRKASQAGARLLVTAPAPTLAALDERLWTFDEASFIAHLRLPGKGAAQRRHTPVWLAADGAKADAFDDAPTLLVNLGASPPADAGRFTRVIEIVGPDPDDRAAGRERWRHYTGWGVEPVHHGTPG